MVGEREFVKSGQPCQWPRLLAWVLATGEELYKEDLI